MADLQGALDDLNAARAKVEQCIRDYAAEEKSEDTPREAQPKTLKGAAREARDRFKPSALDKGEEQTETNFPSKHRKQ